MAQDELQQPKTNSAAPRTGARPEHILVVDDEPFIRNAIKLYLETHGFVVSACSCGEEGLVACRDADSPVDLVLLDLVMPGLHGIDILRQLKAEDAFVEVIIATGCGSMNSAIEALRLGAFDYITKPIVDFDRDLLAVMNKALIRRQERLAELQAHEGTLQPQTLQLVEFCTKLDSLARSVATSESRAAGLAAVEGFLDRQLRALGGVAIENRAETLSFPWSWGINFPADSVDGATGFESVDAEAWFPLVHGNEQWTTVDGPLPFTVEGHDDAVPLEILRVPLGRGEREMATGTLLLLREAKSSSSLCAPPLALVGLVAREAMVREDIAALLSVE